MKYLAAALVTVALLACDFLADMGLVGAADARNYAAWDTLGLVGFGLLIMFGKDER